MKKNYLLYLFSIFISGSLMTQAMEEKKEESVIQEELQKIAALAFPSPIYEHDSHPDDEIKYSTASKAIQQEGLIFNLPIEIFPSLIFPHMDSQTLLNLGATCHFFHELSKVSILFLNDYCLTERMPHQIPIHTLRFKTYNTKRGLLKLAALVSVSAQDLCGWFEPPYLESIFLSCYNSLPQQLADQSEEELGKLYPILKIAVAATEAKVTGADQTDHIMRLVREYSSPNELSFNALWLLSLNPDRPGVYENTLLHLYSGEISYEFREKGIVRSQVKDVIARELLLRGRDINQIYSFGFSNNPKKKEIKYQLLELCVQYPDLYDGYPSGHFIYDAFQLERPDWALKFLLKLMESSQDIWVKIDLLNSIRERKEEEVQVPLKEFSSTLYARYWGQLSHYMKEKALSLLIHAERREDVQAAVKDIFTWPEEMILEVFYGTPIYGLFFKHNYSEEARNFIFYILNIGHDRFISAAPYVMGNFFNYAVRVDRERTLSLLKAYLESQMTLRSPKMYGVSLLAKFVATAEEKDYVTSYVQSLSQEEKGDNFELCSIYYHLRNVELCHFYYQKMIENYLSDKEKKSAKSQEFLTHAQQAGLNVMSIEEMATMDPFEVLSILLKEND